MIVTLQMPSGKLKRVLKLLLKIVITVLCIWYISHKVDLKKMADILPSAKPLWLGLAILAFMASKLLASFRTNIYFRNIDIRLTEWENIRLYWLGMFYNLFLPGSIGGDAYKVVRLTKEYNVPYKKTAAAVLLDRFSGLLALGLLLGAFWLVVFNNGFYSGWVVAGMIICVPAFYGVVRYVFPSFLPGFWPTFAWGMGVQVLQVAAMFCILRALNIHDQMNAYTLIFLASSVVAVLPFTVGGLGARELVFVWGAQWFLLDNTVSVMASALFYGITVISSSFGLPFIFFDPLKKVAPQPQETQYATAAE